MRAGWGEISRSPALWIRTDQGWQALKEPLWSAPLTSGCGCELGQECGASQHHQMSVCSMLGLLSGTGVYNTGNMVLPPKGLTVYYTDPSRPPEAMAHNPHPFLRTAQRQGQEERLWEAPGRAEGAPRGSGAVPPQSPPSQLAAWVQAQKQSSPNWQVLKIHGAML